MGGERDARKRAGEVGGATGEPGLHHVVVLPLPGVVLLDLAAPVHLFGHCGTGRYSLEVAGIGAEGDGASGRTASGADGPFAVPSSTGLPIVAARGLEALREADTVVIPGFEGCEIEPPAEVVEAVRAVHARGGRVMSICTGAFVLGFAGLLDGRRATTHWWACDDLAAAFPEASVDPGVLYVDEGRVLTSAGVASGLDLCLHVIRRDHGAYVAAQMARRTVVAPHRDGGQAQFVARPIDEGSSERPAVATGLTATREWALERLAERLDVATLAAHACVSPRTFARRFREETGTTPNQWVLDQRVTLAQELLEQTDLPIEEVATRAGFGSAPSLREHLARRARTTPTAYRRAFRTMA